MEAAWRSSKPSAVLHAEVSEIRSVERVAQRGVIMSFQLMQDCNDMSCDMSSTEHAVLMVLCRYADDDGNNCFPSTAEIARCSHFAVLPVRKAIAGLEASGWIKSQQESGKKRFFTVDVAKIRGALPLTNQHVGIDQHPRIDQYGGIDQHPRIDQHPDPVSINTGTPYRSIPRKEHIKEQEKDREDSCALHGIGEACPNNQGNPQNGGGNRNKNRKEQEEVADAPLALVPVSHSEPEKNKKGSRITFTELTPELREQAMKVCPDLSPEQVAYEFDCFLDYWRAKAGAGGVKRDWAATWRNWIRRSKQFGSIGGRQLVSQTPAVDEFKQAVISKRKYEEEEAEAAGLLFG